MWRRILIPLTVLVALSLPLTEVKAASGRPSPLFQSPSDIISLINQYRAENGLPAYTQNSILMSTAQGQADWLASQPLGSVSDVHAGPDGSRPRDRAYAAGYGGGQTIWISEIVKGGYQETPEGAVNWWKQSPNHNPTMLASTYIEIGAGVATNSSDSWWYVAVTGYVTGGEYIPESATAGSSGTTASNPESTSAAPAVVVIPVTIAEPNEDGSIIHIIRSGQTLWTISAVYEVPLEQILELNNMSESAVVYPGDEILIKAAEPPTSSPVPTTAPTLTPSSTPTLTFTPTSVGVSGGNEVSNSPGGLVISEPNSPEEAENQNATIRLIVIVALASIALVIVGSFFVQSKPEPPPVEHDPFAPLE